MFEDIIIDMLTSNSVSIKREKYILDETTGEKLSVGFAHRKAYINSEDGRIQLTADIPEKYVTAILSVWGDAPTNN